MRSTSACVGALALLTMVGCAGRGIEGAPGRGASPALAFEISADLAETCVPAGSARVVARDAAATEDVVVRTHRGWVSVTYTSVARGRVTLDLAPETLRVLSARAHETGSAVAPGASAALDANGRGIAAYVTPGASGAVLVAAPLSCPHR